MKKIVLLALLITTSSSMLFATVFKIGVSNFQFTPKIVNAKVGDTILWMWKEGSHTTTSLTIPVGARTWNSPLDASHTKFRYILRVAGTYQYKCTPHFSLGMKGKINVTAALAADLNSFSISDEAIDAILTWKTGSSKDVAYFSVQRSTDGDNFTEIAKVNPDLSNQYRFIDKTNNTSAKYVYYQIEMIDTKGNRDLTDIRMFTQKSATDKLITSLSPNPISRPGHLMLQFNANKEGTLLVQLYNQSGAFVKQTEMSAYKGLNNGHFHLGDLTPGTYYIVCTLGDVKERHAIIVK
jgi:plastocyanin